MKNELENKRIVNEGIDAMDPRLAALAWENFLKRLDGGMPEKEATLILGDELAEFLEKKASSNPNVLLFDTPAVDIGQLKKYLDGKLDVTNSKFWQMKLLKLEAKDRGPEQASPEDLKELKEAEDELTTISNNLLNVLERGKALTGKKDFEMPEKLRKAYDAYPVKIRDARQQLENISSIKLRSAGYRKLSQRLRELTSKLEAAITPLLR